MCGFGSVVGSERSGLKMRVLSRISVLSDGIGVLGERGWCRDAGTKKPAGFVTGRAGLKSLEWISRSHPIANDLQAA
jgi:hypothetical protein